MNEQGVIFDTQHRRAYYAVVVALMVAIASSHQLTPFMLVSALVLLVLARRLHYRSLPLVAGIATVGWIALAGRTFVADNVRTLINGLGAFFSNASVHQVNGSYASPAELLVSKIDRLLTVSLIVLAVIGYLRNRIGGQQRGWLKAVLLLISPLVALAANSYGGEIVFRVLLFSLPFLALLGASALQPSGRHLGTRWADLSRVVILLAMSVGFVFSNYGNDLANYFSPQEISSLNTLYKTAPAGSYLTGLVGNNPWPLENYNKFSYYWYTQVSPQELSDLIARPVKTLVHNMSPYRHSYFVLTSSDLAEIDMTGLMSPSAPQRIANELMKSNRFQVVESNSSILVFELRPQTTNPSTYTAPSAIQSVSS